MKNSDDGRNLLASPWERQGVGISGGQDGAFYITLDFC
jgi:hypothetical protein